MKLHEIRLDISFCDEVLKREKKTFKLGPSEGACCEGDLVRVLPVKNGKKVEHPVSERLYWIRYSITSEDRVFISTEEVEMT